MVNWMLVSTGVHFAYLWNPLRERWSNVQRAPAIRMSPVAWRTFSMTVRVYINGSLLINFPFHTILHYLERHKLSIGLEMNPRENYPQAPSERYPTHVSMVPAGMKVQSKAWKMVFKNSTPSTQTKGNVNAIMSEGWTTKVMRTKFSKNQQSLV